MVFHYDVYPSSPNFYKIQGSNDARLLPAVSYRYVRIIVPPFYPHSLGDVVQLNALIKEVEVYEHGTGDPAINYPIPFDRTGWSAKVNGKNYPQAINKTDQGWLDPHGAGYF